MKPILLSSLVMMLALAGSVSAAEYYVDATGGEDTNNGLTPETAWKTLTHVNDYAETTGFSDGDIIQLKRARALFH